MSKIVGLWSGHDCSFCVLNDGVPELHTELERHNREKEPAGDSVELFLKHHGNLMNVDGFASCHRTGAVTASPLWQSLLTCARGTALHECGHHQAHAAHAFYSSNFDDAIVITIDGGGHEDAAGSITATMTMWRGSGTQLNHIGYVPIHDSNVGGIWTRVTRYVFRMESGWPQGHQAGSVMALAALGNSQRFIDQVRRWFNEDVQAVCAQPPGHIRGMSAKDPQSPRHPYLGQWEDAIKNDKQAGFDLAAALQLATEEHVFHYLQGLVNLDVCVGVKNLCLAGGVALNSVMVGKIVERFPQIENVFIPPVPYDGGLCIGAAQHAWHHVLKNPRVKWPAGGMSPYLGKRYTYDEVMTALHPFALKGEVTVSVYGDDALVGLLRAGCIVSVFNGRAESGRRALGNRSIIADPRNPLTKDRVNQKVKHRQDWRPFAPSIVLEAVDHYFEHDIESPYMSHVVKFQQWARPLLPAVVHFDGSARLQTVSKEGNEWWHSFLVRWGTASGHPVLLNTSFNDREPICETPTDAIKCFLKTDIDVLYFPEFALLVRKTS